MFGFTDQPTKTYIAYYITESLYRVALKNVENHTGIKLSNTQNKHLTVHSYP